MLLLRTMLLFACLAGACSSGAAELRIAAASDLKFALDEVINAYRQANPAVQIKVTYGSSGTFFAQLQNRAPFDLYFSADVAYPRLLVDAGLSLDTNLFVYGAGRIVLWTPKKSRLELSREGFQILASPAMRKVAIANPKHAPYGAAAVAALRKLNLYEAVEPKLVLGENISQAAQFVQSGAADAGLIALSLALAPAMRAAGNYIEAPRDTYPRMEQGGIILKWTKEERLARGFQEFVTGRRGREILGRFGFSAG